MEQAVYSSPQGKVTEVDPIPGRDKFLTGFVLACFFVHSTNSSL
jgi:hypothetical protein